MCYLKRCSKYLINGKIENLEGKVLKDILKYNTQMAERALRVLGVAYVDLNYLPNKIDSSTIENNLIFVGLIGMIDLPRKGVKEAVETCKMAGNKNSNDNR